MTAANDTPELAALFRRAVEHHRQGRLADALKLYDTVVRAAPDNAVVHCNRGIALAAFGRQEDAIRSYDHAIRCQNTYSDAYFSKAVALARLLRHSEALQNYDLAIRYDANHIPALRNKGNTLLDLGRPNEALPCFEQAIAIAPDTAAAHYDKGNALRALDRLEDAAMSYDRAIALRPDYATALSNKGNVLYELQRPGEALASYDRAIRADPNLPVTHYNRGKALQSLNRLDDALASFDRAIALHPAYADAFCNRGNVLYEFRRFDEAFACYDRALALRPDFAGALCNKGMCKLLLGDFAEGWPLYEWRPARDAFGRRPTPRWKRREDLEGRTLLVQAEQGLGDTIQFCRYVRVAREKGARVILAAPDGLVRLLAPLGSDVSIIPRSATPPAFDVQVELLSLPLAFGTDAGNIPARVPYLFAEPDRIARWNARMGNHGFKVGICWQGNKDSPTDVGRSIPLSHFERFGEIAGVRLISLQKHHGVDQLAHLPARMTVETLGEDFDAGPDAFLDTAAVMENLDLVITSDTAIAHLAGALGRPVWSALKYVPDWRWQLGRADSPWYPTMRLFRQAARGDWDSAFADMERELRLLARN